MDNYRRPASRRRTAVRKSRSVASGAATPRAKKETKPTYTVEQIRKAFPDAKAEVLYKLNQDIFLGTLDEITNKIKFFAKANGLDPKNISIARRAFSTGQRYNRYTTTHFALIGFRPYTDEELLAQGPKLVKKENDRRSREYRAMLKKVQTFNRLAASMSQPTIEEPKKPELIKL